MSYYRSHSKTYRSGSGDNGTVIGITVIIACCIWVHRVFLMKTEHQIILSVFIVIGVILSALIYIITKKLRLGKQQYNMEVIDRMTGLDFESYIASLLRIKGYKHIRLTEKYDYGIDIIAKKDGIKWGIQVKRYSGLVKADAVRQVVTALKKYHCDRAVVISNSSYSQVARELAKSNNCILVDRKQLAEWISTEEYTYKMKLIRYRQPSMRRILGYTTAKRRFKRSLGISQVQGWTRPTRIKQRIKYRAGWYSPSMRVARNTAKGKFPSLLGLFSKKRS
jgi:restriction system protein